MAPPRSPKPVPPRGRPVPQTGSVAPRARLVARAGPAQGESFQLEGDELVIGRAAENTISIPDTSVSRRHALVRKTKGGWGLSDLGSGNGTLINGDLIEDETVLAVGDVIALGDTELAYELDTEVSRKGPAVPRRAPVRRAEGEEEERTAMRGRPVRTSRMGANPEAQKAKRLKVFRIVGGVAVVVLALLVGWKSADNKKEKARFQAQQVGQAHEAEMAQLFKDAKALVRQGKWVEARAALEDLQEQDPGYETGQVENYLRRAEAEIPNESLFAAAQKAMERGELKLAASTLAKVKTSTQEGALRSAKAALEAKVVQKLAEARALLASNPDATKLEQINALCAEVQGVRSDDREVMELLKMAEAARSRLKGSAPSRTPPDAPWLEAEQRFKGGDLQGALSLALGCAGKYAPCAALAKDLKDYEAKSSRLEQLGDNELLGLYQLDKRLAGGGASSSSGAIKTRLGSALFHSASTAKGAGNWPQAISLARKVLEIDPSHSGAQALLTEGRNQAREVYLRGYTLKDSNPEEASRRFREVLTLAPPDDEIHQKAKARLAELQGQ